MTWTAAATAACATSSSRILDHDLELPASFVAVVLLKETGTLARFCNAIATRSNTCARVARAGRRTAEIGLSPFSPGKHVGQKLAQACLESRDLGHSHVGRAKVDGHLKRGVTTPDIGSPECTNSLSSMMAVSGFVSSSLSPALMETGGSLIVRRTADGVYSRFRHCRVPFSLR